MSVAQPILFTPGPVKIPPAVARMLSEPPCNYHRQDGFRAMFEETQARLKTLLGLRRPEDWFVTLITSTGTGANEASLHALAGAGKGLILRNGFFAARLVDQAVQDRIAHVVLESAADRPLDPAAVDAALARDPEIKWVYFVSHETRAGLVNPLEAIGRVAKRRDCLVGADVVSSSFAYPIDLEAAELDLAVASSAKAVLGAPGIGMVFTRLAALPRLGRGTSYYLDLIAETEKQRKESQPRFAQPVALHAGLWAASGHLLAVGIDAHMQRIQRQMARIIGFLERLDVFPILDAAYRSNIAVNFRLPRGLAYADFARRMEAEGCYLLYGIPGDSTHFQVSTIGDLADEHIAHLERALGRVLGPHVALQATGR